MSFSPALLVVNPSVSSTPYSAEVVSLHPSLVATKSANEAVSVRAGISKSVVARFVYTSMIW